jgi:hypothetical protein
MAHRKASNVSVTCRLEKPLRSIARGHLPLRAAKTHVRIAESVNTSIIGYVCRPTVEIMVERCHRPSDHRGRRERATIRVVRCHLRDAVHDVAA